MQTIKADCLCGAAKHEIRLPASCFPLKAYLCHCNSCRHYTGCLYLSEANMPDFYQPESELLDRLRSYEFSKRVTDYACKTCGSKMLCRSWTDVDDYSKGATWDVMCGTLEKADGVYEYLAHKYIEDTLDGGFTQFLPSVQGRVLHHWLKKPHPSESDLPEDEVSPFDWQVPRPPYVHSSSQNRLYCHCKCKGVEFWLARPSERSKNDTDLRDDTVMSNHPHRQKRDKARLLLDDGKKLLARICACDSCRLDSGQEWAEWAFVPTIRISLDEAGKQPWNLPFGSLDGWGSLKGYTSTKLEALSGSVVRYHCGICGASAFITNAAKPDHVDVAVGLMNAPEGARAESWLEFWTEELCYRENSIARAEHNTLALEAGLKRYGERHSLTANHTEVERFRLGQS